MEVILCIRLGVKMYLTIKETVKDDFEEVER